MIDPTEIPENAKVLNAEPFLFHINDLMAIALAVQVAGTFADREFGGFGHALTALTDFAPPEGFWQELHEKLVTHILQLLQMHPELAEFVHVQEPDSAEAKPASGGYL